MIVMTTFVIPMVAMPTLVLSPANNYLPTAPGCSQSIQGKQDGLMQRLDALDRENEELREETGDLGEMKEKLEEALEKAEERRSKMEEQLSEEQVGAVKAVAFKKLSEEQESCYNHLRCRVVHFGNIRGVVLFINKEPYK